MVVELNVRYRRYWLKIAKYYSHTSTYKSFLMRIENDNQYKRLVDTYIISSMNEHERQRLLENSHNFSLPFII